MKVHRVCTALAVGLCLDAGAAWPQAAIEADARIDRIAGMATARGGAHDFLQRLTDSIGARVTGTTESRATADLLLRTLREAGFEDARFEEYALESRWQRGRALGRVISPVARPLAIGSYGWVPGTKGEVTAPLIDLGAPPGNDLPVAADRVRGAAVLVEPHAVEGAPSQVMRAALARSLARAGATAMLIPSDKPHRMLYTSAFGLYPGAPLPVLSVAREDVLFLRRLLAGGPVRVTLDVANTFDASPAQERNVVADIKGSTGEVVLVGAHFDSWDPGEGAQDDGVGVAAILEAARILKSLGVKPRRTIRFVFFSGEEQALLGSRAYVEAHRSELDGLRAVVIMDSGAQTPRGFKIHGRSDIEATARTVLAPLSSLGASEVSLEATFDMDHGPFLAAGIPVFTLWVDEGEYDTHHHAVSDTFDKVDPRMLALDTAVMAVAAYRLADAPEAPGRRLSATEATLLLQKVGLESLRRAVYEPATSPLPNMKTDAAAVLAPVNALFAAFEAGDAAAMLRSVYPDGRVTASGMRGDGASHLRQQSWTQFAERVKPDSAFQERIADPVIEIDDDIALVWAPFVVRVGGKVGNCGVDHFDLVRENGAWKVMNLTFSSRTTGCPAQ